MCGLVSVGIVPFRPGRDASSPPRKSSTGSRGTFLVLFLRHLRAGKDAAKIQVRTGAPATPEQAALVDKAVAREKVLIKDIQRRTPLVETYIQDTRPDVKLYQVPVDDQYVLSRVDFGKTFFDKTYEPRTDLPSKAGFFKSSLESITGLTKCSAWSDSPIRPPALCR